MEVDEKIDRERIELRLAVRRGIERFAQPGIAEIIEQQQPALDVPTEDSGR